MCSCTDFVHVTITHPSLQHLCGVLPSAGASTHGWDGEQKQLEEGLWVSVRAARVSPELAWRNLGACRADTQLDLEL